VGYRTAYVSAQNPKYEDFGTFVENAGIDELVTGTDLGGMAQEQIGAPDERAADAMLRFVRTAAASGSPYFAMLHLSNTHAPYRVDPDLHPFEPSSAGGLGDTNAFHNRYRNSVRLQERTVAAFLRQVRALPGWDDTAVVFLSDHGEQFREHGGFFHNHSLFDEELRVPAWIAAGPDVLGGDERTALASYGARRTYAQDVHATLVDLLGLHDAAGALPEAAHVGGRSLLRAWKSNAEPFALLATSTAVWEPDDARYGVMHGDRVLISSAERAWTCFDLHDDPGEHVPLAADTCGPLLPTARAAFAGVDVPP
jgi:arylsulfatase A-like enzyme